MRCNLRLTELSIELIHHGGTTAPLVRGVRQVLSTALRPPGRRGASGAFPVIGAVVLPERRPFFRPQPRRLDTVRECYSRKPELARPRLTARERTRLNGLSNWDRCSIKTKRGVNPILPDAAQRFPHHAVIDDRRRVTVPAPLLPGLSWRTDLRPGYAITYELMEPGRARLLRSTAHEAALESASAVDQSVERLSIALIPGEWAADNRITLPPTVAAHVLEQGQLSGAAFFWIRNDVIEIWSDRRRLFELAEVRDVFDKHLPGKSG